MKSKILLLGASLGGLVFFASQASAITIFDPPTYGAYVVGYGASGQVFQDGVLANVSYNHDAGVESASGTGGGITASADLATGDITITGSGTSGYNTATALFFTKVTFTGNGTGTITFDGTLSESGGAHAEEYVGLLSSAPSGIIPGYSISSSGFWSASSISPNLTSFSFTNGETAYFVAELAGGTFGTGSVTVTDPFSLDLPPGTGFTADAPQFLLPVPEPATWAMLLLGFFGIGFMVRGARRKDAAAAA